MDMNIIFKALLPALKSYFKEMRIYSFNIEIITKDDKVNAIGKKELEDMLKDFKDIPIKVL